MRRIGPVVQGIILERTRLNNGYIPKSHVHALTRDFPMITLKLCRESDLVKVIHHERYYPSAAAKLRDKSVLSLVDTPTIGSRLTGRVLKIGFADSEKEQQIGGTSNRSSAIK